MNIIVFVKQVPDNTKLRPEQLSGGGIPREGVDMMLNPYDEYALETALRLKESAGGDSKVTVISLGSGAAKDIVKKTIATGADEAFLLTDPAFLDGDSTATAQALAAAVQALVPEPQVLLFGQMSLDDAAAQTGPKVAELLGYPSLTASKGVELINPNTLKVMRETERGVELHEMTLPGVVSMMKCDYELRTSNIKGVMKANKAQIPSKTPAEIGIDTSKIGQVGSSTTVSQLAQRPPKEAGVTVDGSDPKTAVDQLIAFLKDQKVL